MNVRDRCKVTAAATAALLVLGAGAASAQEAPPADDSPQLCLDLTITLFGTTFGSPFCLPG